MRTAVFLTLLASGVALSGCSTVDGLFGPNDAELQKVAQKQRLDRMTQDVNGCVDARKTGRTSTRVEFAACVNDAFQRAMLDVNYPYPDIVATLSAERLRVAEAADKGQITDTEGQARLADRIAEVVRLERARGSSVGKSADRTPPAYFLQLMQIGL